MQTIEFFFDFTCPYAYLASTQVEGIATRTGAPLKWRPMLLGGVFRALDVPQVLFKTLSPSKAQHNFADMVRWADFWGVPLSMPSGHPYRSVEALRAVLSLPEELRPPVIHGLFRAYWVLGLDIAEKSVIEGVLRDCGVPLEHAGPFDQEVKDALRIETEEAIQRGVFGAPAVFLGDELYWGQDRLWMVEEALGGTFPHPKPELTELPQQDLKFYFDISSPFAFLAAEALTDWSAENGVNVHWKPIFLGGLFKSLGGPTAPLVTFSPSKQKYVFKELHRWAAHRSVPLNWPSRFPMLTIKAMRILLSLGDRCTPLALRLFRAYWVEDLDIKEDEVLAKLLAEMEFPPETLNAASDPHWKQALIDATAEAQAAGVFGVPTFEVGTSLIWGQDRFLFVEGVLNGWKDPGARQ